MRKTMKECGDVPLNIKTAEAPLHGDRKQAAELHPGAPTHQPQPTIRLGTVSALSAADQRRLELLLDALIERRVIRHLERGST